MSNATTATDLPPDGAEFLERVGWGGATVKPLAGDASFRRYFRIRHDDRRAMLMYAPPPEEDVRDFLDVARWLTFYDQRAPAIYCAGTKKGFVLTEDFGDDRMRDWLDANLSRETAAYEQAVDALVRLHEWDAGPFAHYDMATYLREAALFVEWFCPLAGIEPDPGSYEAAWREVLGPLRERHMVTVLRDYHAENIMLIGPDGARESEQGLIDFQDALAGHPAYDLVSLLQDARRDVSLQLEAAMLDRYRAAAQPEGDFLADYARLGAQRNAKIVGIFARLWKRDGKPRYLGMIPRVWSALERDLAHPSLAPVARWFDANIPSRVREQGGGGWR